MRGSHEDGVSSIEERMQSHTNGSRHAEILSVQVSSTTTADVKFAFSQEEKVRPSHPDETGGFVERDDEDGQLQASERDVSTGVSMQHAAVECVAESRRPCDQSPLGKVHCAELDQCRTSSPKKVGTSHTELPNLDPAVQVSPLSERLHDTRSFPSHTALSEFESAATPTLDLSSLLKVPSCRDSPVEPPAARLVDPGLRQMATGPQFPAPLIDPPAQKTGPPSVNIRLSPDAKASGPLCSFAEKGPPFLSAQIRVSDDFSRSADSRCGGTGTDLKWLTATPQPHRRPSVRLSMHRECDSNLPSAAAILQGG